MPNDTIPLPEPYGRITTHTITGQQFFYRWPESPYLDNAKECIEVAKYSDMHAYAAAVSSADNAALRSARIAYASEFPLNADGEHDVGNIHANIRAVNARVKVLEDALRDIAYTTDGTDCNNTARAALGDKT